jgi:hypothetical protein
MTSAGIYKICCKIPLFLDLLHAHDSAFEGIMLVAAILLALEIGHLL